MRWGEHAAQAGREPAAHGDELDVHASALADQHRRGMTHSTRGMIHTPSELIVHGRLLLDGG